MPKTSKPPHPMTMESIEAAAEAASPISPAKIEAAAAAIANARIMRRGSPPFNDPLGTMRKTHPKLVEELLEDAKAALEAAHGV